jgi:flagellar protein FliO/FliZ
MLLLILHQFSVQTLGLLQTDTGQVAPEQFQSGRSLLWMFVQTILALGFVCVLAYVVLRVVLPRIQVATASKSMVHVVDRSALDQRRSLYVIEVTGRWLLVGVSEAGVHLVTELDPEKAEQEAETLKAGSPSLRARATLSQASGTARTAFTDVISRMAKK